jgi:hypothetical protein
MPGRTRKEPSIVAMRTIWVFFAGFGASWEGSPDGNALGPPAACSLLEGAPGFMNAHFFGTKRAFHGILRITRKPLASFGLTAARYDMLYAIFGDVPRCDRSGCLTLQSELPRKLGGTSPWSVACCGPSRRSGWCRDDAAATAESVGSS